MTAEQVWMTSEDVVVSFTIATTVDEALVALGAGSPDRGGTDLVVGARHGDGTPC